MGKARKKPRVRQAVIRQTLDATPERLAKGDDFEFINPAEIDDTEQPIGYVRRFRASKLDRLYRTGRLTWGQWYAGEQYRSAYHRSGILLSVIASYGERTSAGEISYGLARTERQATARQFCHSLMNEIPFSDRGFMMRFLVHDELPRYGGRKAMRSITQIRKALDAMAVYLKLA